MTDIYVIITYLVKCQKHFSKKRAPSQVYLNFLPDKAINQYRNQRSAIEIFYAVTKIAP